MELRHLRYFVAAAEEQHFGRAAERLRIAQPALSRQIQDLENEIGFELFDRLPRGVKISAAGKSLLEDARSILKQADEAVRRAGKVAHQSGILRVGFIESLSWHGVVPRSFRQFRRRHPDARLELRSLSSLDQVEAVRLLLQHGADANPSEPQGMHGYPLQAAAQYGNQMQHFYKNMAILGGIFLVFACGAGRFSLDAWLRKRR